MSRKLTQWGVVAQFHIVALESLFGSPAVICSLHDDVNFLIAVLTHISTEYPALAVAADRVSAVHRASPHVSDPICKHLWTGMRVSEEGVIRGDPVLLPAGVTSIYINAENFSQQCAPVLGKMGFSKSQHSDEQNMISRYFKETGVLLVLCISVLPEWIPGFSTISREDVQISIMTKQELASVVVCSWFLNF